MKTTTVTNSQILGMSVGKEKAFVRRQMADPDRVDKQEELANDTVKLHQLEEQLKALKEAHKLKADPIKKSIKAAINVLNQDYLETEEDVFLIPNEEKRTMEQYDAQGICVGQRPMTPEEKRYHTVLDRGINA